MRIAIWTYRTWEPWGPLSPFTTGIGGAETAVVYLAKGLANAGHEVIVYLDALKDKDADNGVSYISETKFTGCDCDVFIAWRTPWVPHKDKIKANSKILWMHDANAGNQSIESLSWFNKLVCLSEWHKKVLLDFYPSIDPERLHVIGNGIDPSLFTWKNPPRRNRLVFASMHDRGLDRLLTLFPRIQEKVADAELHLYYGIDTALSRARRAGDLDAVKELSRFRELNLPGVVNHGRVPQQILALELLQSKVLAFPTHIPETFGIVVAEAQAAGCIPVTSSIGALPEVARWGLLLDGHPDSKEYRDAFVAGVIELLTNEEYYNTLSFLARDHVQKQLSWDLVVEKWDKLISDKAPVEPIDDRSKALAHIRAGRARENLSQLNLAFADFTAATILDRENPDGWFGLGRVACHREEWQTSVDSFARGFACNKPEVDYYERGYQQHVSYNWALSKLGRYAEALESVEAGLRVVPDCDRLLNNRKFYREYLKLPPVPNPEKHNFAMFDPGGHMVIMIPSRKRPERALATLLSAKQTASTGSSIDYLVGIEPEDEEIYRSCFGNDNRLMILEKGGNYVAAMREMYRRSSPASIYGLLADDFIFESRGWDSAIRAAFAGLPERIGVVWANDGNQGDNLATAPFLSHEWIETVGDVLPGNYTHLFCDTELTDIAKQANVDRYLSQIMIRHNHYSAGKAPYDETYRRNDASDAQGRAEFSQRASIRNQLAIEIKTETGHQPVLSVLICGLSKRITSRQELLNELWRQRSILPNSRDVEILVLTDNGQMSIGTKRNRLVTAARGEYVCFIDDDDMIEIDYMTSLLEALRNKPDCVTFKGIMTTDGSADKEFDFSLRYRGWSNTPNKFLRNPNHLCPVPQNLARSIPFPEINLGEDRKWSDLIYPHLHNEIKLDKILYHYRWSPTGTTVVAT